MSQGQFGRAGFSLRYLSSVEGGDPREIKGDAGIDEGVVSRGSCCPWAYWGTGFPDVWTGEWVLAGESVKSLQI